MKFDCSITLWFFIKYCNIEIFSTLWDHLINLDKCMCVFVSVHAVYMYVCLNAYTGIFIYSVVTLDKCVCVYVYIYMYTSRIISDTDGDSLCEPLMNCPSRKK